MNHFNSIFFLASKTNTHFKGEKSRSEIRIFSKLFYSLTQTPYR